MKMSFRFVFTAVPFLVLLTAALLHQELLWQARRWRSGPPPSIPVQGVKLPPCSGCNVILISADTLRADAVDWSENSATPNLARLGRKSVRFSRAYSNAFYTTPAHMTLFTSLYPNRHKVTGSEVHILGFARTRPNSAALSTEYKTLAEVLAAAGYHTRWYGPLTLKHLDLNLGFARGFQKLAPTLFHRPGRSERARFDGKIFSAALSAEKPFFYFLHSYITHLPYFIPEGGIPGKALFNKKNLLEEYQSREDQEPHPIPDFNNADRSDFFLHSLGQFQLHMLEDAREFMTSQKELEDQAHALKYAYALSVASLDRQIGELWQGLEVSGRHKDTMVVLFSDHGEEIFEHGHGSHSTFYEHTARVPLLIYHPKLQTPAIYDGLVSLVDLAPTLLATLAQTPLPQAQGLDLNMNGAKYVFGFALGSSFVTDGEWKLFRNAEGADEFYNLHLDPLESQDLSRFYWPAIHRARARLSAARDLWELEQNL